MGDHVVVQLDRLIKPETVDATRENGHPESNPSAPSFSQVISGFDRDKEDHKVADEGEPLIQTVECRICQEEDQIKNLETPCACSGSLKVNILAFFPQAARLLNPPTAFLFWPFCYI